MDAAFCLRQQGKGSQAEVTGSLGQAGTQEKIANLRQAAAVLVLTRAHGDGREGDRGDDRARGRAGLARPAR